jgi:hypothetical protein
VRRRVRTDHTRYALFPNLPFFATCRRVICLSNAPVCAPTNRNSRGLVCLRRGVLLFRGNVLPGRCFGRSTRRGFNAHASDLARETCVARSSRTRGRASTNPPGPEDTTSPRAPPSFRGFGGCENFRRAEIPRNHVGSQTVSHPPFRIFQVGISLFGKDL